MLSGPDLGGAAPVASGETRGDGGDDVAFARQLAGDDAAWTDSVLGLAPVSGNDSTVLQSSSGGGAGEEDEEDEAGDGSDMAVASTPEGLTREALLLERAARLLAEWRQLAAATEEEEEAAKEAARQLPSPQTEAHGQTQGEGEGDGQGNTSGDGDDAAGAIDKPGAAELAILPGNEEAEEQKQEEEAKEQPSTGGAGADAPDLQAAVAQAAAERAHASHLAPALTALARRAQRALRAAVVAPDAPHDALACIVRGMVAAGLAEDVEAVARTAVVGPVVATRLTRGRVDAGARGSFRGLAAVLRDCVGASDGALAPLAAAVRRSGGRVDVWRNALWPALADALADPSLGDLTSPGDAATMHSNYVAVLGAVDELARRREDGLGREWGGGDRDGEAAVAAFLGKFNLDLYAQVRG